MSGGPYREPGELIDFAEELRKRTEESARKLDEERSQWIIGQIENRIESAVADGAYSADLKVQREGSTRYTAIRLVCDHFRSKGLQVRLGEQAPGYRSSPMPGWIITVNWGRRAAVEKAEEAYSSTLRYIGAALISLLVLAAGMLCVAILHGPLWAWSVAGLGGAGSFGFAAKAAQAVQNEQMK